MINKRELIRTYDKLFDTSHTGISIGVWVLEIRQLDHETNDRAYKVLTAWGEHALNDAQIRMLNWRPRDNDVVINYNGKVDGELKFLSASPFVMRLFEGFGDALAPTDTPMVGRGARVSGVVLEEASTATFDEMVDSVDAMRQAAIDREKELITGKRPNSIEIPEIGRMVRYMASGSHDGFYPPVPRVAVITEVTFDPMADWGHPSKWPNITVKVLNPTGDHDARVKWSGKGLDGKYPPRTWHWPERVYKRLHY